MNDKGFTLIEVVITVGVVGFALVSYLGANYAIEKASEGAYQKSVAVQDAQQVIEHMRSLAQTGTFPGNVTATYPNNATLLTYTNLNGESINISYANATADPLDVTVTVTYNQNSTRAISNSIRTLITQRTAAV